MPLEGGLQAEVIEHPRPVELREFPHMRHELAGGGGGFGQFFLRGGAGLRGGGFELEFQAGEHLTHLVVQLAGDGAAFVFLNLEQTQREGLQLGGAGGYLRFERVVECLQFPREPDVLPFDVGPPEIVVQGENEFAEIFLFLQNIILRAELEGGDGGLTVVAGGEQNDRQVRCLRAELAQDVERLGIGGGRADHHGLGVGALAQKAGEFTERRGDLENELRGAALKIFADLRGDGGGSFHEQDLAGLRALRQ